MDLVVTVVLANVTRRRLANAFVTLLIDEANSVGLEATTDRYGPARFTLSKSMRRVDAVGVQPLHSGWPVRLADVDIGPAGLELEVPVIDLAAPDARGLVYGRPSTPAGSAVKVGVVDTGVGPHSALTVVGGRNTTTENTRRRRDEEEDLGLPARMQGLGLAR